MYYNVTNLDLIPLVQEIYSRNCIGNRKLKKEKALMIVEDMKKGIFIDYIDSVRMKIDCHVNRNEIFLLCWNEPTGIHKPKEFHRTLISLYGEENIIKVTKRTVFKK